MDISNCILPSDYRVMDYMKQLPRMAYAKNATGKKTQNRSKHAKALCLTENFKKI